MAKDTSIGEREADAKAAKTDAQLEQTNCHYRTSRALDSVKGKVTGRHYSCTEGTLLHAPEGEFEGVSGVTVENHS